ncbi:MAG TPA: protein-L-isoaspartate O-methyltransferase [Candidatus Nanoarchaeia archaeon]|nr:protein-L-isoaspartate O-methyltransferase [Candidatus Nanoarchaeia archaeon]
MDKEGLLASLKKKGFSESLINAFNAVKREDFVPEHLIGYAYEDLALPVMEGSTLSQPSTVAFMLDLLQVEDKQKILEIGSGSGYVLALLKAMNKSGHIYGLEILKELAIRSKNYFANTKNVDVVIRNGSQGLPEFAPYDRILISASCQEVPRHLLSQLTENGILVAAVKQSIFQIKKSAEETIEKEFPGFAFVPLRE